MNDLSRTAAICRYYEWHAGIYDKTRWSFLFGRRTLLREASANSSHKSILEIGCGTGANLERLARLQPEARLSGVDLSPAMLAVARRRLSQFGQRIELHSAHYLAPLRLEPAPDLILISYCLSMINPGWEKAMAAAVEDLAPGGRLAVVDFHSSPFGWFRQWMRCNHVKIGVHLASALTKALPNHRLRVHRAFAGAWKYFLFFGAKPKTA